MTILTVPCRCGQPKPPSHLLCSVCWCLVSPKLREKYFTQTVRGAPTWFAAQREIFRELDALAAKQVSNG